MTGDNPIRLLVLEEFRLRAAELDGEVARIVAATPHGIEPAIPLLTSIEDRRDVATLRALHGGETAATDALQHALDGLFSSWAEPKHYAPRITERSQSPPSSYRLAVTESGINVGGTSPLALKTGSIGDETTTSRAVGLIWVGAPIGTHAGLLVLLGGYDDPLPYGAEPSGWPLPLSRDLGVRVYKNRAA